MSKRYYIDHNTKSVGIYDKWRLKCNKEEILVRDVYIDGLKCTYGLWNEKEETIKYHLKFDGDMKLFGDIAMITTNKKEPKEPNALKRHILKTISYRILGTITTFSVSYVLTGSVKIASTLGVTELLIKPIVYFLHERVWYKFVKFKK
jgi:uncharacterized membrane protein